MIGNNACGSRAVRYGRTADNVAELDVLTGSGERLVVRRSIDPGTSPTLAAVQEVVGANLRVIRTELGRFSRQISGYSLEHLLPENGRRSDRFLVGTEGTAAHPRRDRRAGAEPVTTTLVVLGYP